MKHACLSYPKDAKVVLSNQAFLLITAYEYFFAVLLFWDMYCRL